MAETTLILHGWSDCSDSFRALESFLVEGGVGDVETIYYADYESREDAITYGDVVGGLQDELRRRGLIDDRGRGAFDVVVHSTGGLVIRQWIWRYYGDRIDECPVENLVMLAPANFGSPLAHRGKSLLGRLFLGRWKVGDMLEVGRKLLDGLELGSAHQWELAHRDLLGPDPLYDDDRIRLTLLVGLDDYEGLRGWVDKPGTDGAVVVAGVPLDAVKLTLDFCSREHPRCWKRDTVHGSFAFGVLPGLDHGSVVDAFRADHEPDGPRERQGVGRLREHVLSALRAGSAAEFREHRRSVRATREAAYHPAGAGEREEPPSRWQQFLLRAVDDQGQPVRDFTVEFSVRRRDRRPPGAPRDAEAGERADAGGGRGPRSREVNRLMTEHFHTYGRDPSHRRMLVDVERVADRIPDGHVLAMSLYVPRVADGIYYDTEGLRNVVVHDPAGGSDAGVPDFFHPNTTTLLELRVDRVTDYVRVGTEPRER